tara:strand:- start:924 stop:1376 length:453 start_codon:yes stop_codon:yes gene_type:complete
MDSGDIMTIEEIQNKIQADFQKLEDSDDKWSYLLKIAKAHPVMDEKLADDKFLVQGCATRLYCVPQFERGSLMLNIDTDQGDENPMIVRGLAALASQVYSGQSPKDILVADPSFFQNIGLNVALSATRANGFASLLKQIYMYAQVYARIG